MLISILRLSIKHIVSISEAQIFKTLSITEDERKKADAYKKKDVIKIYFSNQLIYILD